MVEEFNMPVQRTAINGVNTNIIAPKVIVNFRTGFMSQLLAQQ